MYSGDLQYLWALFLAQRVFSCMCAVAFPDLTVLIYFAMHVVARAACTGSVVAQGWCL